ncbi:U3 small nucleolar RNA-associated protein 6 homolog [Diachasma alloeum]|uniref:U3 small nucleolar RNA-associated protein 6 homolog n=1 Tax=Diachasma alloeum TaxID=454923 RepID=UPI00073819AD|nr:U3 small nucleolar RNA-associated protein 6 homolog [Diachasma alloeum]
MAERVQKRCENSVQHLELMEKIKLFDAREIRGIIKKRKDYEYKLSRTIKSKEDYLRYIQYEMDLLKLLRQRRTKFGITQKKRDIDYGIVNRVMNLYREALERFKDDLRFYVAYMKFCKQVGYNDVVSRTLTEMLQIHGDKPKCHHIAGKWELEERKNINNARTYFINGINHHQDSQLLYTDAFQLELDQADEASQKSDDTPDASSEIAEEMPLGIKRALIIYKMAFKKVKDVTFIINLLNLCKLHKNTKNLQNEIISDLTKEYSNKPQMWETMARRELEGLSYDPNQEESMEVETTKDQNSLRDRITNCNEVYQAAVKKLKSETMWSLYIDCLLEINQDLSHLPNYKRKLLKNALIQADQAKKLEEKYYLYWLEMLTTDKKDETSEEKLYQVMCYGTDAIPTSVNLWTTKIKHLINSGKDSLVTEEFAKASKLLGGKALPLWRMKLLYFQAKYPQKVHEIFVEAMKSDVEISKEMKPAYIEWLVLTKGIEAARQQYNELAIQPPTCLELHKKMLELEMIQPKICKQSARKPHELATLHYGKSNTQVWIDFILFEMKHGEPMRVTDIHRRAVKTLQPALTDAFITEYSLIKANPDTIM